MIQDVAPHRFSAGFRPCTPGADSPVVCFAGEQVVCGEGLRLPTWGQLSVPVHYGFTLDDTPYFIAAACPEALPEGFVLQPARPLRTAQPSHLAWAIGVGHSLARWYRSTAYCGACGKPMQDSLEERARVCTCGQVVYPKISPAVIVAVTKGDYLLLTRYANRPFKDYALIGGFHEIGETIEETVRREVFEETGLRVKNLRYVRSQPWVFTDSLLLGFTAELDGDDTITMQESELCEAGWFHRSAIPYRHSGISLTGEMIEAFRNDTL